MANTAKDLGFKVGQRFEITKDAQYLVGDIVELVFDDNSWCPYFSKVEATGKLSTERVCEEFKYMKLIEVKDSQVSYTLNIGATTSITINNVLSAGQVKRIIDIITEA